MAARVAESFIFGFRPVAFPSTRPGDDFGRERPVASLAKNYKASEHEGRIWGTWESAGAFHADPRKVAPDRSNAYGIIIPPPNVTGRLHLGHALNNTLQDILIRMHRMRGMETLWMPGTDHAGIATQSVVEKRLQQEEGKKRNDFSREEFVGRVQAWKDEYEATITNQLKKMGCSCDFKRQRFTMDDICAKAVREAFFRLFKDGLIYRGKRLVNWDPLTQTALADDEVVMEEIEGAFYYLRYPVVRSDGGSATPVTWSELARLGYPGAEQHPGEQQAWVTVATTRPETYLGDTAVAVNPDDPRWASLQGLHVCLPLVGRIIPIIADNYVVMPAKDPTAEGVDPKAKFATGFLKVTPAHDPNDYEIGQRHNLAAINIMAPDASISDAHGWSDVGDARLFVGLSREDARQKVVAEFKSSGLLEQVRPYSHSVGHSDRSGAAVEPYLSDQWYVKVTDDRLRGAALRAMTPDQRTTSGSPGRQGGGSSSRDGDGSLTFFPDRYARTFETWHENLRDWCISRQLWWGHRIPVWNCSLNFEPTKPGKMMGDFCDAVLAIAQHAGLTDHFAITEVNDSQAFLCVRTTHAEELLNRLLVWTSERHHGQHTSQTPSGLREVESACHRFQLIVRSCHRDPDVLDTWFSSALWPISTMGWPEPASLGGDFEALLKAFNPTSVLCTAREIITLWVSRMVMFNRYFMGQGQGNGPAPFRDVFIHAMIQDGQGQKMSKSLGNGVDPLDIVETHGADAMRFVLCHMTTQTQDVRMPVDSLCPHCTQSFEPKTITNQAGYVVAAPVQQCPHCTKPSVSSYGVASNAAKPDANQPAAKNTSAKFDMGRNFCTKLWNAARFTMMILEESGANSDGALIDPASLPQADRWMLSRLAQAVEKIERASSQYEFSVYAQTVYELLWWDFCDWYLEAIKPTVRQHPGQQAVLRATLDAILRLLHPVCPFITEAIFEEFRALQRPPVGGLGVGPSGDGLLCRAPWPTIGQELRGSSAVEQGAASFERVRALVEAIRQARSAKQIEPKRRITLHARGEVADVVAGAGGVVETLAGLAQVTPDDPPSSGPTAILLYDGRELTLSGLVEAMDPAAERAALVEAVAKLEKDIDVLDKRLANPGYAQKAPEKMVQETRDTLARKTAERDAMRRRIGELG